jgi:hypothetical protein
MKRLARSLTAVLAAVPLVAITTVSTPTTASAEDNGVGQKPAMGWTTYSFLRHDPTAARIEAEAKALKDSGLASVGYQYVNLDGSYWKCGPDGTGPEVDSFGRWVPDPAKFPNGIKPVADYVHSLGLKFGIYVNPGIPEQAVKENTPIEGTPYTADEIAEPSVQENSYFCGGMVGINYSKPGAQAYIDSWADEFASWGVDYLKIDGVGSFDIPDVKAWSEALRQTGRPIHLELSNNLSIQDAAVWQKYSNGWRTGNDIECYSCESGGSSYPLTDWANVETRFNEVAGWQPYGGPGGYNDLDSIEVGNGSTDDGINYDQSVTQLSLWALGSSPLILGADLTHLTKADLKLLLNRSVIAVDEDGIDASRLVNTSTEQVFAKTVQNEDVAVGLFNISGAPETITTTASALGMKSGTGYLLNNLWAHHSTETADAISATVPSDGVALFQVSPLR